mgnify:CR=1 FL=1
MNKYDVEVVRDYNGLYYANMFKNGERVTGIPEYVNYRTLKKEIEHLTGFSILPMKTLKFKRVGRKQYARFNNYSRESEHLTN